MGSTNESKGGYVGQSPTQNTGAHPGAHAQVYAARERREGRWPGEAAGGSFSSSTVNASGDLVVTFSAPSGTGIVGNNGTDMTLSGNLGTTTIVVGTGTSGTGWSISGFVLTIPNATITTAASGGQTFTLTWGSDTFVTSDGFSVASGSTSAVILPGGTSSADAAGSAKALQGAGVTTSGTYWIKNGTGSQARQMYCDMTTDGGGWPRYANYVAGNPAYSMRYSNQNYNVSSTTPNVDTEHYCAHNYRLGREAYSDNNLLEYLFEVSGGNYRFKMNAYHNNDPKGGIGRGFTHINNNNNSHFDAGWFNNSNNGYWYGVNSNTNGNCVNSTNIIHYVNGASSHNGGYFGVSRGYKSDCCTSSGCGDHCGNVRRYWQVFPYVGHSQHCFSGYHSFSAQSSSGRVSVYLRERGTLPSGGY